MVWTTGTRQRAITVTGKGIFCAAAAGHAHAQVTQPANDTHAKGVAVQFDGESAATLPEMKVKDVANVASVGLVGERIATGTKTDTPITEVPQTINVVTAQQIEMTGATDLNQALRYVPGFASFGSDSRTDLYAVLRGFTPTLFIDGLQAPNTTPIASWRVDPYMIDSITVLRGPTSVL